MSNVATEAREGAKETFNAVRERVTTNVSTARDTAMEKVDETRERAAGGTESVAEQVRGQAEGSGGIRETAGMRVADTMEKTAIYLREHETNDIFNNLEVYERDHPTQTIMGAVAVCFVLGRILQSGKPCSTVIAARAKSTL